MKSQQAQLFLPAGALIELIGILTLITNESIVGPVDIGFTVPALLISGNIQGFALLFAGLSLTMYAIFRLKE